MLLIAPTERQLHALASASEEKWRISPLPERHGCDVVCLTPLGVVGFQRKTLPDLVASLTDGRLYYELNQIITSATVSYSFLVIEASFAQTIDGQYTEANISVSTLHSLIAKFHLHGIGFLATTSPASTLKCCLSVSAYIASGKANVIHRPKNNTNEWGRVDNRSYAIFLLQSFQGIGPKVAAAIYDHFKTVPIVWNVTAADLARVPGVGRKRAEALIAALTPAPGSPAP